MMRPSPHQTYPRGGYSLEGKPSPTAERGTAFREVAPLESDAGNLGGKLANYNYCPGEFSPLGSNLKSSYNGEKKSGGVVFFICVMGAN